MGKHFHHFFFVCIQSTHFFKRKAKKNTQTKWYNRPNMVMRKPEQHYCSHIKNTATITRNLSIFFWSLLVHAQFFFFFSLLFLKRSAHNRFMDSAAIRAIYGTKNELNEPQQSANWMHFLLLLFLYVSLSHLFVSIYFFSSFLYFCSFYFYALAKYFLLSVSWCET